MMLSENPGDGFADAAVLIGEKKVSGDCYFDGQIRHILHRLQWPPWDGTYSQTNRFLYVNGQTCRNGKIALCSRRKVG